MVGGGWGVASWTLWAGARVDAESFANGYAMRDFLRKDRRDGKPGTGALDDVVKGERLRPVPLAGGDGGKDAPRDRRWSVLVNEEVEVDL